MKKLTAKQKEITAVAIRHIVKHGVEGLRMKSIADELNISETAAYKHFKTKDELLDAVARDIKIFFIDVSASIPEKASSIETMKAIFLNRLAQIEKNPHYAIINRLTELMGASAIFRDHFKTSFEILQQQFVQIIKEGQQKGEIKRELNPDHIHDIIIGTLHFALKKWSVHNKTNELVDIGKEIWQTIELFIKETSLVKKSPQSNQPAETSPLHERIAAFSVREQEFEHTTQKLLREKEKYAAILNHALNAVVLFDAVTDVSGETVDYILREANHAFEQLTGFEREKVLGKHLTQIVPVVHKTTLIAQLAEKSLQEKPFRFEYYAQHSNKRHYEIIAFYPQPGVLCTIFSEMTDYKKTFSKLEETEERLLNFIEQIDDLVITLDTDGKITHVNNAAEKYLGLKKERCLGLYAFDFVHPDDYEFTKAYFYAWIEEKTVGTTFENRLVSRKGDLFTVRWIIQLQKDRHGSTLGSIAIGHDITELRQLQQKLTVHTIECNNTNA